MPNCFLDFLFLQKWAIFQKRPIQLIKKVRQYLGSGNEEIQRVFYQKFGIDKKGKSKGVAKSLISKYFYFLLDYEFPIYDSLVKDYLPKINKRYSILNYKLSTDTKDYFTYVSSFNTKSSIESYNRLDNLCWLYGKVSKGSFSLLIDKDKYLSLISSVKITSENSREIDRIISQSLMGTVPQDIFSSDEVEFINWVYKDSS